MGVRAAHFGQTFTGPQCGAEKPHPTKQCFKIFQCPFPSAPWQDMEAGLPAQGASLCLHFTLQYSMQCLHLGCRRTPPRAGFHRLCGSSMARGRCVTWCHQGRAPVITGLQRGVYLTSVPQNSSSEVRVSQIQPNTSSMKISMWGNGRWARSRSTSMCSPGQCSLWRALWKGQEPHKLRK